MLKNGRRCLSGHRMEMVCIRFCLLLCWLLPIAAELLLRRLLPTALLTQTKWQAALLAASVFFNRLLVASAHGGYYACCCRLAFFNTGDIAATRELVVTEDGALSFSLLSVFFRAFLHPLRALRRQLSWDLLRLFLYAVAVFPGLFLLAVGGNAVGVWQQALFAAGGVLFCLLGAVTVFLFLQRFLPAVYLREQYPTIWAALAAGFSRVRGRRAEVWGNALKTLAVLPLSFVPFLLLRTAADVGCAAFWQRLPGKAAKKRRFLHTRVLNP